MNLTQQIAAGLVALSLCMIIHVLIANAKHIVNELNLTTSKN